MSFHGLIVVIVWFVAQNTPSLRMYVPLLCRGVYSKIDGPRPGQLKKETEPLCAFSFVIFRCHVTHKVEGLLVKAKLPSLRALVHVWNKQGRPVESITEYLFRNRRYEHLQVMKREQSAVQQ